MSKFERIKKTISKMDAEEALRLSEFVSSFVQQKAVEIAIQRRTEEMLVAPCVHCGFSALVRNGKTTAGVPRFKCRSCGVSSSATTGKLIAKVRKRDSFLKYMELMRQHHSIAFLQKHHFPKLAATTLLRWRHRIMEEFMTNPTGMTGIVQADEKFFRLSFKGRAGTVPAGYNLRRRGFASKRGISSQQVAIATATDSTGRIGQELIGQRTVARVVGSISPWLSSETVLVSDGYQGYAHVARAIGCLHIVAGTNGMNLNRMNNFHGQVENLVNRRCLGVSTRHLMKYFAWQRYIAQDRPFGQGMLEALMA